MARFEQRPGPRCVIVTVGEPDRRVLAATSSASRIPAEVHRAVHVASGAASVERLGLWWMEREPGGLQLEVLDDHGGVAATVATVVHDLISQGFGEVFVVVGQLVTRSAGRRFLHENTASAISNAVNQIPGATCVIAAVLADR